MNDRGRPLAVVEKVKSLLIYYSNRFLAGKHDAMINCAFGEIFRDFARLKDVGEHKDTQIGLIAQSSFTEDTVLRYHFLAYPNSYYDFKPTKDYVLDGFLKPTLRDKQGDSDELASEIESYVGDLKQFVASFLSFIEMVHTDPWCFKLCCILGMSTHLYPLAIRLQERQLLDKTLKNETLSFSDLLEIADIRIYKTRGTDPVRDVCYLARDSRKASPRKIWNRLGELVRWFMDDSLFELNLTRGMYGNEALLHLLITAGEDWAMSHSRGSYSVEELIQLMQTNPTIDHIFAQDPRFTFPSRGFSSADEYTNMNDHLGNLTVLEKSLNSRCQNKLPTDKIKEPQLSKRSQGSGSLKRPETSSFSASGAIAATSSDQTS